MSILPPELEALVENVISRSRLTGAEAREVRADLTQHLRDGLDLGRSIDDLTERFGDPAIAGPLLARSAAPRSEQFTHGPGDGLFASLVRDVRHALKGFIKNPSLAVTATIVLALGVGANTVVFTVVNELLLRPLPVKDPATLIDIWSDIPGGNSFLGISYQDFLTYRADTELVEGLVAFTASRLELGDADDSREVVGQFISPGYFELLGLSPSVGTLSFDPDLPFGAASVTILSHGFWVESFGGDPAVLGQTIRLGGEPMTIVGVGPPGFSGHFIGFSMALWLPIAAANPLIPGFDPDDQSQKGLEMIGRLRAGTGVEAAGAALNSVAEEIEVRYPSLNRGHRVGVTSTTGLDHSLQAGVTAFVLILTAVSALVLLIACLNVGSMLLVRAMAKDHEIALRIALGAGRGRLVRQLVTESTLLSIFGAIAGVGVAVRLSAALADTLTALAPGIGLDLSVDWRVLALTTAATMAAAGLASVAPAFHISRKDPVRALRARGGPSLGGTRLRAGLVVGQVAVSVVLVVGTGLFVRALVAAGRVDPGFDADAVASFVMTMPDDLSAEARLDVQRLVLERLEALPTIDAVTLAASPPLGVARSPMPIDIPGVLPPPDMDRHVVDARVVGPGYLNALGISLQAGRDLRESDDRGGPAVAIVSEAFVARYWPEETAVGRSFTAGDEVVTVVGVARDARYIIQDESPDPLLYLSRAGQAGGRVAVTVRGTRPLQSTAGVNEVLSTLIPGHGQVELRTAREALNAALLPQRLGSIIVGAMGLAALFLAAVGLYGIIQFTVARDTHELGVRLALGGGPRDVLRVVLRKGFRLVAIGVTIGVSVALLVAPGLSGFLAGVSPFDPVAYFGVVGCFLAVAMLASWLPARHALRINATDALRHQ